MTLIGVTGGFGTGKSTVARMLGRLGAEVIDADAIVHELFVAGSPLVRRIAAAFGRDTLNARGAVDRRRLGRMVFDDPVALRQLNRLVHPAVRQRMRQMIVQIRRRAPQAVVVLDVPLLIEGGLYRTVDVVVVVVASRRVQVARLRRRTQLPIREIERRLRRQMSLTRKRRYANVIVDNGGSRRATQQQVKRLWQNAIRPVAT
jgi:dephospho-CoA kinase